MKILFTGRICSRSKMKDGFIDFHAHILPGADHGSDGIEVSRKQLDMAQAAGIGCIVATPHYYPNSHSIEWFLKTREKAFDEISAVSDVKIKILCAAEVLLCEGLQNLPELECLKIGNSNTILIEMPAPPWTDRYFDALKRIKSDRGLEVILAHVERYKPSDVETLFSLGLRGQINASAYQNVFLRRRLSRWIESGCVIALGSDIHGVSAAYTEYLKTMRMLGSSGDKLQYSMYDLILNKRMAERRNNHAEDIYFLSGQNKE
jgi:protein-tyrosine phosphatase